MSLKGETTIELTDVKTGEVEKFHDDNIVTNALKKIVEKSYEWGGDLLKDTNGLIGDSGTPEFYPILDKLIGGIICFSDTITESVDKIVEMPSVTNPVTAYGTNKINNTVLNKLGSLNITESGKIVDGYKFVWDFTTSQGNGPISCVCLTTPGGGLYGNDLFPSRGLTLTREYTGFEYSRNGSNSPESKKEYLSGSESFSLSETLKSMTGEDFSYAVQGETLSRTMKNLRINSFGETIFDSFLVYARSGGVILYVVEVTLKKSPIDIFKTGTALAQNAQVVIKKSVNLFSNTSNNPWRSSSFQPGYETSFYDFPVEPYIKGNKVVLVTKKTSVEPTSSNTHGSSVITITTIDDITKEEPVVTFRDVSLGEHVSQCNYYNEDDDIALFMGRSFVDDARYDYVCKKFKISNMSEVSTAIITSPQSGEKTTPYNYLMHFNKQSFVKVADGVYILTAGMGSERVYSYETCKEFLSNESPSTFICTDICARIGTDGSIESLSPACPPVQLENPTGRYRGDNSLISTFYPDNAEAVILSVNGSSTTLNLRRAVMGNLLFTINNLSQPVTKTADKTMKITYVLREV